MIIAHAQSLTGMVVLKERRVLPGFGLTLGYALESLSLIVLLPPSRVAAH
jgi:hypothetical protein